MSCECNVGQYGCNVDPPHFKMETVYVMLRNLKLCGGMWM